MKKNIVFLSALTLAVATQFMSAMLDENATSQAKKRTISLMISTQNIHFGYEAEIKESSLETIQKTKFAILSSLGSLDYSGDHEIKLYCREPNQYLSLKCNKFASRANSDNYEELQSFLGTLCSIKSQAFDDGDQWVTLSPIKEC